MADLSMLRVFAPRSTDPLEDVMTSDHTTTTFPPLPRDEERVVAFLRAGVPLSLLLDLAGPDPHSKELYLAESTG